MENPFLDMLFSQDPVEQLHEELQSIMPAEIVHLQTLPEKWSPDKGIAVVVADDASQGGDTAHDRNLVRVTVHAHSFDLARKTGRSIAEYLFTPFGGLGLAISRTRSTRPIVGPSSIAGGFISTASYSCGTSRRRITNA